ncbi:hypothetical protein ABT160_46010 [Streptomyces sp. NPDC001941]|uniref:hypothetical protein n=1 Tax=Streptomyces sp. NPDC001941 TaxID=3154659 RepID=UPI00332797E1
MAAAVTRGGVAQRYGVRIRPMPHVGGRWGVYLADRMPDDDPPDAWTRAVIRANVAA